jgi:putative peptidoglycan lipid II flippase
LRREGFRYRPVFDPGDAGLRQVLVLMGPGTIGLAATQVNIFVNTLLATSQGTGAVSWLTYAFRVMYLPIGLFGVSIGTALLPAVSRHAAVDDRAGMRDAIARGLAMMLMVNVPATLGLVALATPIVQLLFERGQFVASDTAATAAALQWYALGLVGYSAARIVSPTFYAIRQSRVPVFVSTAAIATNVALSLLLVRWLGFRGLALATSLVAVGNAAMLIWLLRRRLDGLGGRRLPVVFVKIVIAAIGDGSGDFSDSARHESRRTGNGSGATSVPPRDLDRRRSVNARCDGHFSARCRIRRRRRPGQGQGTKIAGWQDVVHSDLPMSRRPASPYASSFSFGPGPISTTLQLLIGANVVVFVAQVCSRS